MLYQMSEKELDSKNFMNPPAYYRGAPFWSWNCQITKPMIDEQLQYFKEMGMGGVHIHVRVGLRNQYMGDEFLELVRYCNEKAKELGLLCWLYDEDRYASGYAGGKVTRNIKYRARYLRLTTKRLPEMAETYDGFCELEYNNEKVNGCYLKAYDIVLDEGYIRSARIIDKEAEAKGTKWYLYMELEKETPWCNNQTYVDTMNSEATQCFISYTHEKYAEILSEEFGRNIPAIFTDEPHFIGSQKPKYAQGTEDILLPFTDKLPEKYRIIAKRDFYEVLPCIVWNSEKGVLSKERYYFYETCSSLFTECYCQPIYNWCKEHHLISTGHVLSEETLQGQANCVGDAMRCYTQFQMPGIDNLCDYREYSTVKQASSIAHQYRKEGVSSECYGVTQWDFDFKGYKMAGDWQAALGITMRVPHLAWASMAGESKRDYPAAIGWQSPWYREYHCIEDHFGRVNYCLTRGEPEIHIAVIHPVESMWVLQGPSDQNGEICRQLEADFQNVTKWLLTGAMDFDYISEAVLEEEQSDMNQEKFVCGAMSYEAVVIPGCIILRDHTIKRLQAFAKKGGKIIMYGQTHIEALRNNVQNVYNKTELLNALRAWRQLEIWGDDGNQRELYVHQLRKEKECKWLFLAQAYTGTETRDKDAWNRRKLHEAESILIKLKGSWSIQKFDTVTGNIIEIPSYIEAGRTCIPYEMYGNDSLLLRMSPRTDNKVLAVSDECTQVMKASLEEPVNYILDEPNALLLDTCWYSLDGGEERTEEEILRADNVIRSLLGYPLRMESVEQPYVRGEDIRNHRVSLRMFFESEIEVNNCMLAMEEYAYSRIYLNGEALTGCRQGFYVDRAITTIPLPMIQRGTNELAIELQYGKNTNLEWMYILGDFGVEVRGKHKKIVAKPDKLYWGDYTKQGFPFYTGNMTYEVKIVVKADEELILRVPYYEGAAVKAEWGRHSELLAFLPNECVIGDLKDGDNIIRLTCLGNRYNGFGQLHMIGDDLTWVGPNSWRTKDESWTDTYRLKEMGIISAPLLIKKKYKI